MSVMAAAAPTAAPAPTSSLFEFDEAFQTKIAALAIRDSVFNQRVDGLLRPEQFTDAGEASLVAVALGYYQRYKQAPDATVLIKLIKDAVADKRIRSDVAPLIKPKLAAIFKTDISDRDYVVDQVAEFARHQAVEAAILESVGLLAKRDFAAIEKVTRAAVDVGASQNAPSYDYFDEIEARTERRREELAGTVRRRGISTGISGLDRELYHNGWGRKELSLMMGPAKVGKSMSLIEFAKSASLLGYNVLFVTLEVSKEIVAERLDANMSDVTIKGLGTKITEVEARIKTLKKKAGALRIEEFPSGTLTCSELRRLLARHRAKGLVFDLIVVDYADLMAPDHRVDNPIENSRTIYIGLRAIAYDEDAAVLTATQTNREGAKAAVAKMTDVAEDFNRIRIADITISINVTDDERAMGEARLFFAASRNQASGFTLRIKQDLEKAKFLIRILARE